MTFLITYHWVEILSLKSPLSVIRKKKLDVNTCYFACTQSRTQTGTIAHVQASKRRKGMGTWEKSDLDFAIEISPKS